MAIYQGGSGNNTKYYSTPDDAAWTFPDSDWCLCMWIRIDDNSGTGFMYLFSNNNFVSANSINVLVRGASASNPNEIQVNTDNINVTGTSASMNDGKDRLVVVQRVGGNIEINLCVKGQAATQEVTTTYTDGEINGGVVNIGRRVDGDTLRYWHDTYGDVFKGSVSLTLDQITLLGQGVDPVSVIGFDNLDVWFQFREAEATVTDVISGIVATRNATPVTVEHFPFVQSNNMAVPVAGAAPSGRIMGSLANHGGLAGLGGIAGPGGGLAG